jgi:hypothetical protein
VLLHTPPPRRLSFFSSPKNKYIRITKDENFSHDKNYLSNTPAIADSVCSYDLDQLDEAWLKECNGERSMCGLSPVNEEQFERIIEELEVGVAIAQRVTCIYN